LIRLGSCHTIRPITAAGAASAAAGILEVAMKIVVDRDECIGCGNCSDIAPAVFELDDEGLTKVVDPQGADDDTIREAAESCPVDCIHLYDDSGNQVYP